MIRRRPGRFATKWTQKDPAWVSRAAARPSKISNGPREFAYLISLRDGGNPVTGSGRQQVEDLLPLALSRPHEALARARAVLAARPDPYQASVAHQAAGIVLRDVGDVQAGVRGTALRAAAGPADRLGGPPGRLPGPPSAWRLVHAGRTAAGLAALDRAAALSSGAMTGQVLHRRGIALWTLGRYRPALDDLRRAVAMLQRAGDPAWTARALNARGLVYVALGSPGRADDDFVTAGRLYAGTGQQLESVHIVLNRALAAFSLGDLPDGAVLPGHGGRPVPAAERADASAQPGPVRRAAGRRTGQRRAGRGGRRAGRHRAGPWPVHLEVRAAADGGQLRAGRGPAAGRAGPGRGGPPPVPVPAERLVAGAHRAGARPGPVSRPARCRRALLREAGPDGAANWRRSARPRSPRPTCWPGGWRWTWAAGPTPSTICSAAARSRRHGPALARASGWLGEALRAEAAADPRRMLAACRRGLEVLDEYRLTLGASELRAQATAHGTELAVLAQRHARPVRPAAAAAELERALAGHRAGRARGTAPGRGGAGRQPGRAARDQHPAGEHPAPGQAGHACCSGNSCGWSVRSGPRSLRARGQPGARPQRAADRRPAGSARRGAAHRDRGRGRRGARAGLRRRAGTAVHRGPGRARPPGPPTWPGSRCAAWPAAGPAATWRARWPS